MELLSYPENMPTDAKAKQRGKKILARFCAAEIALCTSIQTFACTKGQEDRDLADVCTKDQEDRDGSRSV